MRRIANIGAVVALVFLLVIGAGAPAQAVEPPPPPVQAIPDLLSKSTYTNASWADGKALQMLRAIINQATKPGTDLVHVPKPITAPAPLARPVNAGGVVAAFPVGWAIGQGGLAMYAFATGGDYNTLICSQPDWYQAVNSFLMLGTVGCKAPVSNPNYGAMPGYRTTFGSAPYTLLGPLADTVSYQGSGGPHPIKIYCSNMTITQWNNNNPLYQMTAVGRTEIKTGWDAPPGGNCGVRTGTVGTHTATTALVSRTGYSIGTITITRKSDGVVMATATEMTTDLNRTARCKITWTNGSVTTGTGAAYKDSTGFPASAAGTGCESAYVSQPGRGPGLTPSRIQVDSEDDGGAITEISDQTVPPLTETQTKPMFTPGNGTGLILTRTVAGIENSCNTWAASCVGWWSATSNGTVPGEYKCTFGGIAVALVECGPYRNTFEAPTSTPTITAPDGTTQPWVSAQPSNGNSTDPGAGITPGDQCLAEWASVANPIEWVLQPIKCAFVWAFIPRPANVAAVTTSMTNAFEGSTIGALAASAGGLAGVFDANSGCGGLPFDFDYPGGSFHGRLFASCDEPWAGVAAVTRNILSGVIIVGSFLAILRYGAGVFGFVGLGMGLGDHDTGDKGVRFK